MQSNLKTLVQVELAPNQSHHFYYAPSTKGQKAKAVLISNEAELSLAFKNGTNLILNSFVIGGRTSTAPNRKILIIADKIDGQLKGVITNISDQTTQVSAYLVLQP